MDVSRLLAVLSDVQSEIEGNSQQLAALIQQYTVARDSPSHDNAEAIRSALEALRETLERSRFNQYPPSRSAILERIDGIGRVGSKLFERVREILSVPGQTTAAIVSSLGRLQADLQNFQSACSQAQAGLSSLGLVEHRIPEGSFEVGVLIPENLVDSELGSLTKRLDEWNRILRGFQEVSGDAEREVLVDSLASGSYELFLSVGLVTAGLMSKVIDKVLDWYIKVLEIRRHRLELERLGVPVAETRTAKQHERRILDEGIKTLVGELMKGLPKPADKERQAELETQLTVSIRHVARFVDAGGDVEVDTARPVEPEEPRAPEGEEETPEAAEELQGALAEFRERRELFDQIADIRAAGASLRNLPARVEAIFQLTDGNGDEEAARGKKKAQ
jgi:hypothetical protein